MSLRMRSSFGVNIWPGFTDIAISMLLIFMLFVFMQFIANHKALERIQMEKRQAKIERIFRSELAREIDSGKINIDTKGNFQQLTFSDQILFGSGEAELKPDGRRILERVCRILIDNNEEGLYERIQIEGHTDNVPLRPGAVYSDNWRLSSDRAIAVVLLFDAQSDDHGFISLLSATGFSKYQPVEGYFDQVGNPYFTDEERDQNRRIEIRLVYLEESQ